MKPTDLASRILVDHGGEKGLGDIVCELNAYAALRKQYPDAALVSRGSRTLAWGNPLIDAFDESSPDMDFDHVLRMPLHFDRLKDALTRNQTIFEHFMVENGLEPPAAPPRLYVLPEEIEAIGLEADHPDDLIIAYSVDSKEPDRRWGEERFAELIQGLQQTYGGTYVEIGSGFTAGHVGIGYDLVGQTDLRQTMAILSEADLFIGNHGGLTHLAGGLGTPILCPWGASNPYAAYAYDDISIALETTPECRHCAWAANVHADCRETSVFSGRTACTQTISVTQMREAADRLLSRVRAERDALRAAKRKRTLAARDPKTLERFETPDSLDPYTNMRLFIGGAPGWGREHRVDNYARLRKIVAFPDWLDSASAWDSLVTSYVSAFSGAEDWVLVLSAAPLAGPEAHKMLDAYLRLLERTAAFPKIMLIFGNVSDSDRRALIRSAAAYVPLKGPYHLEDVPSARYITDLTELSRLAYD